MDERDLFRDLSKMIRGELTSGDVKRLVTREGFKTFSELCETRLPEDLGKVRIGTRDILTRIDRYRRRTIDLYELWFWADELYNISFNHRIAYEPRSEELITSALSAISVIANGRLFPNVHKTQRSLDYIRACLLRRRKLHLRNIFLRIFEDIEVANLANKSALAAAAEADGTGSDPAAAAAAADAAAAGEDGPRWADVVLLDRPWRDGTDIYSDYNWMIAFTVTARSLYEEERAEDAALEADIDAGGEGDSGEWICPECERERREKENGAAGAGEPGAGTESGEGFRFEIPGWQESEDDSDGSPAAGPGERTAEGHAYARPRVRPTPHPDGKEVDRAPALRRLVPNFNFERYKPRYLYDGDGIAEIVLEAPHIGPREVEYATRLFAIANRVREVRLGGEKVKCLVVRPGIGKRAEK